MQCPICRTVRLSPEPLPEGPVAYACDQCGGRYVRSMHYHQWLEKQAPAHDAPPTEFPTATDDPPVTDLPVPDSKPGKLCPECGAFLISYQVGQGLDFHVDHCGHCGGSWLDRNEWDVLRSRDLHNHLHFVFSEAWQRKIKHAERRQQYRQVIGEILDDKLAQVLEPADRARLHEIREWLDGHPHAGQLYAYLLSMKDL